MARSLLTIVAICSFAVASANGQTTQRAEAPATLAGHTFLTLSGDQWHLAFDDEFDGDKLDSTKWSSGLTWAGDDGSFRHHNAEYASYITDDNITLAGGQLQLLTQHKDVTNPRGQTYHYTQAFIQTDGKFAYTYGYCEVRVKVPTDAGPGLWPAFWMLARGWPPEDDVAEFWTGRPRPHTHQGFAYRDRAGAVKWESRHEDHIREGFHTFDLEWGPGYQLFNRDGVVTVRVYGRQVPGVPMYLILNSGVAARPGPTTSTVFPNAFAVDYVRVYARPKDAIAFHNTGFEDETAEPWSLNNGASVVSTNAHAGQHAIRLTAGGAIAQTVYDLQPNTKYEVKCWINADADSDVRLSIIDFVSDHGPGDVTTKDTNRAPGYHELTTTFTTGPRPTSATIMCTQAAAKGVAYVDDFAMSAKAATP